MSLDLRVYFRVTQDTDRRVRARLEGVLVYALSSGFAFSGRDANGTLTVGDIQVSLRVASIDPAERRQLLARFPRPKLRTRFAQADRVLFLNGRGAGWQAMVHLASALAKEASGTVHDPADGSWLTATEALRRLTADELHDESPQVLAVQDRLQAWRERGYLGGPAGIEVVYPGTSSCADTILQFVLMAAADIDEAEAFDLAINCPLQILEGELSVDEARAIVEEMRSIGIDARVASGSGQPLGLVAPEPILEASFGHGGPTVPPQVVDRARGKAGCRRRLPPGTRRVR